MESFFKENIACLRKTNSALADLLESMGKPVQDRIGVVNSKRNGPVPFLRGEGSREVYLHSRVDPEREASRFVEGADLGNRSIVVICGFAFGYHCEEVASFCSRETLIVIIEKDCELLLHALWNRDLTELLVRENVVLLLEPLEDDLDRIFKGRSSRKLAILTHRGSAQVYGEYYEEWGNRVRAYISTKDVNIATLAKFEKSWSGNLAGNILTLLSSPGVNSFYDRFSGMSAIVVAAGPSLTQSLDLIRKSREHCIIVAVDTAFKILLNNGIEPHFCLAVDPQLINARYFEGTGEVSTVLIADPMVHPSLFRFFRGRKVLTGLVFDLMKWLEDIVGRKGEISHGGSVSTNAVDFARRLGVERVYMVGQDLSFTQGLAHCKGSYLEEQIHNSTFRFKNAEMFNRLQIHSLPGIFLPSIGGGVVRTNQKMIIFKEWFTKQHFENLINLSHDGVIIDGVRHEREASLELGNEMKNPRELIDSIYKEALPHVNLSERLERLRSRISDMLEELNHLAPLLERALIFSKQLDELLKSNRENPDQGKVNYIVKKLSETDRAVESMKKTKGMISFSIQRVIHTITEGYDDMDDEMNSGARSVFMYRGLLQGVRHNKKVLEKMLQLSRRSRV